MQQNLITYKRRLNQILSPPSFFSNTFELLEPKSLDTQRFHSLHLPEVQLLDKSLELDYKIKVFDDKSTSMKKSFVLSRNSSPRNRRLQKRGTILMIDDNEIRKFEIWYNKLKKKQHDQWGELIIEHYVELFSAMSLKQNRLITDIYSDITEKLLQNPIMLIQFTLAVSTYFLEIKDFNKSSFLGRQAFIISKLLSLYKERAKIMLFISKICQQNQYYEQSLQILEDGLAYSWLSDDQEEEALIYEQMGLSLFYLQQQKRARIFHFKYVDGKLESYESQLRITTIKQLQLQERLNMERGEKQNKINEVVLSRLQLPFLEKGKLIKKIDMSIFEDNIKYLLQEISHVIKYETILLRDNQQVQPKIKLKITQKYLELKRKSIKLQWKQRERLSGNSLDKNINEFLKERNKQIIDCQTLFRQLRENVANKTDKELEPIYIGNTVRRPVIVYMRKVFDQLLQ